MTCFFWSDYVAGLADTGVYSWWWIQISLILTCMSLEKGSTWYDTWICACGEIQEEVHAEDGDEEDEE